MADESKRGKFVYLVTYDKVKAFSTFEKAYDYGQGLIMTAIDNSCDATLTVQADGLKYGGVRFRAVGSDGSPSSSMNREAVLTKLPIDAD